MTVLTYTCLGQKIASYRGLVSRATSVYRLEHAYSFGLVMKYSWRFKTHRREDKVIRAAREADPAHTPDGYVQLLGCEYVLLPQRLMLEFLFSFQVYAISCRCPHRVRSRYDAAFQASVA